MFGRRQEETEEGLNLMDYQFEAPEPPNPDFICLKLKMEPPVVCQAPVVTMAQAEVWVTGSLYGSLTG
jgi:hypothetical protein